jgi:hypothetical protein
LALIDWKTGIPCLGEYFNINDFNNLSLDFGEIGNLTHEYYEYEQGQADIIVKNRLKKHMRLKDINMMIC